MLNITEQAGSKIKDMMAAEDNSNLFLRVGVKAGGCSGFSYGMGFDDEQNEDDIILEAPHGLKVVVDPTSANYLNGVKIDYKESMMGGGFTIDNPNAVASCGCGSSFRTKEEAGVVEKCD
jgi:iron-sulfur cluster assembly protein